MGGNSVNRLIASLVVVGALGAPSVASAQQYNRRGERAVVVECAPGQRAVVGQRRSARRSQVAARCSDTAAINAANRSRVQEWDREEWDGEERSATKTGLMIGGAAAAGAGVGGAIGGTKGALIGAAVSGGAASIYEATQRR